MLIFPLRRRLFYGVAFMHTPQSRQQYIQIDRRQNENQIYIYLLSLLLFSDTLIWVQLW
jgi:hypothetical protein